MVIKVLRTLGEELAEALKAKGVSSLLIGRLEPELQRIAVKMLTKGYGIIYGEDKGRTVAEELGVKLLRPGGEERAEARVEKGGEIPFTPPETPQFVLDFSLWNELDEEEKRKTLFQVEMAVATIRKWLWEGNIRLANLPPGITFPYSFAVKEAEGKCVVLDPKGDDVDSEGLRQFDVFIIGAVVDKGRRLKNATLRIAEKAGYDCPRVRIALWGSTLGVPDEINKIVEIVLRVKRGEELDKAILGTMSKSDLLARAKWETDRGDRERARVLIEVAKSRGFKVHFLETK